MTVLELLFKDREKVFGIFQLEVRDRSENTRIGLVVKKIVEPQGATTSLESQQGKKATFIFGWQK